MRMNSAPPAFAVAVSLTLAVVSMGLTVEDGLAQEGRRDASGGAAVIGAMVGGTVGLFAGAYIGGQTGCTELCIEIFSGGLIGEVLGVALGAHAFNGGRGSLLKDLGTSAGVVGIGLVGSALVDSDEVFVASLIGQVIAVSVVEVRTSPLVEPTVGIQATPEGAAVRFGLRIH